MKAKKKKTLEQIRISVRKLLEQERANNENKEKNTKQFLIEFVKKLPPDYQKYVLLELFSIGVTAAQLDCKPGDVDDPKSFVGHSLQEGVMKIVNNSDGGSEPHFQLTEKGRELFIDILFTDEEEKHSRRRKTAKEHKKSTE